MRQGMLPHAEEEDHRHQAVNRFVGIQGFELTVVNAALKDFFEQGLTGKHHLGFVKLHHIREIAGFAGHQFGDAASLCIANALPPGLHGVVHHVFGAAFELCKFFVPDRKVFGQIGANDGLEQIFFGIEI